MDYYDFRRFCKKKKQKFVLWLKRMLRSIYFMGKTTCIFIACTFVFVLVGIILIFSISGVRHKKAEAMAAELAAATPVPTVVYTTTPVPTPSPTPEVRIEKGQEGEDVLALQKRLMELGYLAIDEPTSYFGNATKSALKLFQRQHNHPAGRHLRQRYALADLFGGSGPLRHARRRGGEAISNHSRSSSSSLAIWKADR